MKTINLKKYYYPICKKDTFVEVPDEVADAIAEESRAENANDAKQHYHCYSLDADVVKPSASAISLNCLPSQNRA